MHGQQNIKTKTIINAQKCYSENLERRGRVRTNGGVMSVRSPKFWTAIFYGIYEQTAHFCVTLLHTLMDLHFCTINFNTK